MARPRTREEQGDGFAGSTEGAFLVRALAKGLAVLALFDAENREWTLDEIAERAGLPRMTAYRMIRTMEAARYLVRDPVTNRYHLGPALLAATYLSEGYAELVEIAKPYLRELTDKTGESATLAVEVDGVAVSVDLVDTPRPFRREVAVGRIIGDTANANGKVFAAFKTGAERAAILAQPHPQITPNTITDPKELAAELDRVAQERRGLRHGRTEHGHLRGGRPSARSAGQSDRGALYSSADRPVRPGGAAALRRRGESSGRFSFGISRVFPARLSAGHGTRPNSDRIRAKTPQSHDGHRGNTDG